MIEQAANFGMARNHGSGAGERVASRTLIVDGFVVQASVPASGDLRWRGVLFCGYNAVVAFEAT